MQFLKVFKDGTTGWLLALSTSCLKFPEKLLKKPLKVAQKMPTLSKSCSFSKKLPKVAQLLESLLSLTLHACIQS